MSFFTKLPEALYRSDAFAGFRPASAFDLGTARALVWLSQLAYETDEPDKIERVLGLWGMRLARVLAAEVATVLPIAVTHGFAATRDDALFICFGGTDPIVLANWITDFNARIAASNAAEGYQVAADSILPAVADAIAKSGGSANRKIYVTGHSLGGSLAVLAAQRLASAKIDPAAIYTFGMPRPGNKVFAELYDPSLGAKTYRLVHGEDVVPSVAPDGMGFQHVGRYLHCERQGRFDASKLAALGSNEPTFDKGVSRDLVETLHRPFDPRHLAIGRLALAAWALIGRAPPGTRRDLGGFLIELLPPRLRDHMPDRYIASLTP